MEWRNDQECSSTQGQGIKESNLQIWRIEQEMTVQSHCALGETQKSQERQHLINFPEVI